MKSVEIEGKCLQCDTLTHIQLENGKYVCQRCLNKLGKQQKNIYERFKKIYKNEDIEDSLSKVISVLKAMKRNGCTKTDHCIKCLESFEIKDKLLKGKNKRKLKKMLDMIKSI